MSLTRGSALRYLGAGTGREATRCGDHCACADHEWISDTHRCHPLAAVRAPRIRAGRGLSRRGVCGPEPSRFGATQPEPDRRRRDRGDAAGRRARSVRAGVAPAASMAPDAGGTESSAGNRGPRIPQRDPPRRDRRAPRLSAAVGRLASLPRRSAGGAPPRGRPRACRGRHRHPDRLTPRRRAGSWNPSPASAVAHLIPLAAPGRHHQSDSMLDSGCAGRRYGNTAFSPRFRVLIHSAGRSDGG